MTCHEEVVQPDYVAEIIQYMAIPCNQPTKTKYGPHLRPEIMHNSFNTVLLSPVILIVYISKGS